MQVRLAGYNVDADQLGKYKAALRELSFSLGENEPIIPYDLYSFWQSDNLTPETLSAAYARISRAPESVGELRRMAVQSVARARKSNKTIVFEYGHHSVAEHAVFNIDITGISRLAVETIEARRLASYTEKSQRYIALTKEYIIPFELEKLPIGDKLRALCDASFELYAKFLDKLEEYAVSKGMAEAARYTAREDARYILPLACAAQLGMTANARTIEHLLRRTLNHPLKELQEFGAQLKFQVERIAPSLILFIEPDQYEKELTLVKFNGDKPENDVELVNVEDNIDDYTLTGLIFSAEGLNCVESYHKASTMLPSEKRRYFLRIYEKMDLHSSVPRPFETPQFGFQLCLSASAFAQLKRHRMASLMALPYDPVLGYTIPDSIMEAGLTKEFREHMSAAEDVYSDIFTHFAHQAIYAMTNAHKRVVYFQANARELYHLSRLRMDPSAQWDIRTIASRMIDLAKGKAPLTMALAGGKDEFEKMKEEF